MEEIDYKKEIFNMLNMISCTKKLKYIYIIIKNIIGEWYVIKGSENVK